MGKSKSTGHKIKESNHDVRVGTLFLLTDCVSVSVCRTDHPGQVQSVHPIAHRLNTIIDSDRVLVSPPVLQRPVTTTNVKLQ